MNTKEIKFNDDIESKEVILEYPCKWEYKIIASSKVNIKSIIENILNDRNFTLKASKKSSEGNFQSYSLSLLVHSDTDRRAIYEQIRSYNDIKLVL